MIRPKFILFVADLLLATSTLLFAYATRFTSFGSIDVLWRDGYVRIAVYLAAIIFSTYFYELYEISRFRTRKYVCWRSVFAALTAFFLLSAIYYMFPVIQLGRGLLLIALGLTCSGQMILRLLQRKFSRVSRFANRTLIVGVGELAQRIGSIIPHEENPHSYLGFVSSGKETISVPEERIVGNINDIGELIHDYRPHRIIVALSERRGRMPLKEIMHSKLRGVEVFDAPTFYESETGRLLIENIHPSSFIYTDGFRMTSFMRSYKRVFDILFSSLGLILASPLLPLVAVAIKLDSKGTAIYKQLRVGEREVEFFVYKFRTMTQDAEKDSGAVWAQKNDPRVTKIGSFLRKTRLDEIPQLYNVLKGDMSFVGPRPERLAFVERLKKTIPYYSTRHFIKPGVTGWAQVRYPYGASEEDALEKLRYDLFYIKNYSIVLDLKIIVDTVRVVGSGFGGR